MTMDLNNGILTLYLVGRIDTANSAAVEKEIEEALSGQIFDQLILSLGDLEYLSSTGLRVVLRLRKRYEKMRIVDVQPDVYDIFEMTGFTEMMPIERAYRRISVEGCEVIGQGANGKVYRIDQETIVKVYLQADCLPDIQRERDLAKKAFVLGIPTAISYEIVRIDQGFGTVFELLNATSLAKMLAKDSAQMDTCVALSVDLLKVIHGTLAKEGDMPDMKETALAWATFDRKYLPNDLGDKLVEMVREIPKDNHVMHGDYHIKNVMVQNGEALLIDMDTLCLGHPIFEFGSMYNAYKGFPSLNATGDATFLGISKEQADEFWIKSLKLYLNTENQNRLTEVSDKAAIVGLMRLLRRSIRRNADQAEIDHYRNMLVRKLEQYDTLLF